jgi:hypothetical protein
VKRKRPTVVPSPDRVRSIRAGTFGWIDHRFTRDGHIQKLSLEDIAVYVFLVLAADRFGVSHWRPDVMGKHVGLDVSDVRRATARLTAFDLVAFKPYHSHSSDGFFQVLSLPKP